MNNSFLIISATILLPTLIACTPSQINSAIEACKGDPACYEIIDEAIEEELSSKGITGGKMTNIEMNQVYLILNDYQINNEKWTNDLISFVSNTQNSIIFSERELLSFEYFSYQITEAEKAYYQLQTLNSENKQLFINAGQKFIVYKIANDRFKYEIMGEKIDEFIIDISLEALYFNGDRLYSLDYILDKIINNQYLHRTDQQGNQQGRTTKINEHLFYFYSPSINNEVNIISAFDQNTFKAFSIRLNDSTSYLVNGNQTIFNGLRICYNSTCLSFEIHKPFSTTLSELHNILSSEEFSTPYSPAIILGHELPYDWQEVFEENFLKVINLFEEFENIEVIQTIFSQNLNNQI